MFRKTKLCPHLHEYHTAVWYSCRTLAQLSKESAAQDITIRLQQDHGSSRTELFMESCDTSHVNARLALAPNNRTTHTQGEDLAEFLGQHRHLVAGKRVLDLGTGTGIAGLAAAQCGAQKVTLTDHAALGPLVQANLERNAGVSDSRVTFTPFSW